MSMPGTDRQDTSLPGTAAAQYGLVPRLAAEAFGTLFLMLAAVGVPLFTIPQSSPLPAPLAAGLAVTAAMLAFGHVSGGHFNPAITLGHLLAGRIRTVAAAAYMAAQLAGAMAGALVLYGVLRTLPGIADSRTAFDTVSPGYGEHSIIQAPLAAGLLLGMLGAALIVAVFLGAAGRNNSNTPAAALAVGLSFAVLLQLGQAIGNLPFNPARAAASAVFSSAWAMEQLWVFVLSPLAGAAIAGLVFRALPSPAAGASVEVAGPGADGGLTAAEETTAGSPLGDPRAAAAEPSRSGLPAARAGEAQAFFDGDGKR
ncbi:aquaporin [Pseudarthrobacter sp. NPDC092439]|uniref:aquaporin n=1 Tax=unclassified Pseudarthrobacter TaxID=2647000 RepID=UPI0037F3AE69